MKKISLKTVAAACGVTQTTVSLALNGHPRISQSTRDRICQKAKELGYEPNRAFSRMMRDLRKSDRVLYRENLAYVTLIPRGKENYNDRLHAGALERSGALGYGLEYVCLRDFPSEERRLQRQLSARGIRGILLSPFAEPHMRLRRDWSAFACISIGYTLESPLLHRIGRDMVHPLRLLLENFRKEGFIRIGLVMERSHEERMDFANLSGFLSFQHSVQPEGSIPPLIADRMTKTSLLKWFRKHHPDLVLTTEQPILLMLNENGIAVPERVSVFLLNCSTPDDPISGWYPDYERLGAVAVEQVSGLLDRGEFGVPENPTTILVPGKYCPGKTCRPPRNNTPAHTEANGP